MYITETTCSYIFAIQSQTTVPSANALACISTVHCAAVSWCFIPDCLLTKSALFPSATEWNNDLELVSWLSLCSLISSPLLSRLQNDLLSRNCEGDHLKGTFESCCEQIPLEEACLQLSLFILILTNIPTCEVDSPPGVRNGMKCKPEY